MDDNAQRVFLTAEWKHLAMLNYIIDPAILEPLVPRGTELDLWQGKAYASVVGFLFRRTRLMGFPVPFHTSFPEVNLRFYVKRKAGDGSWRRGVTFVKEVVPRWAIAFVARKFYNEPYIAVPMGYDVEMVAEGSKEVKSVAYFWRYSEQINSLKLMLKGTVRSMEAGSEEEFIAEHHWGYTRQADGSTLEYKVEHPRWHVCESENSEFVCDMAALYGEPFRRTLESRPTSAFLAEGSAVKVYRGLPIK